MIIFAKEFEELIKETGFSIYLSKGYNFSTKGKVKKFFSNCVFLLNDEEKNLE